MTDFEKSISANPMWTKRVAVATSLAAGLLITQPNALAAHRELSKYDRRLQSASLAGNPSQPSALESAMPTTLVGAPGSNVFARDVQASLKSQRKYLLALLENWDGYGASQISEQRLDALYAILAEGLGTIDCRPPDIIPGGDGSIQAEWHLNDIELTYSVEADGSEFMTVSTATASDLEFYDVDARSALRKWAPHLAKKGIPTQLAA